MDAVEEVKNRLSIEDVIGEYVQLKRAGRNFRGLSPFNSEKTPSFMVSPEKQIWHDFSSNKGGNMFGFVMEMEGTDFKGALEILARKAGIDLEQFRPSGSSNRGPDKERLLTALEIAARFYQVQFAANSGVLKYVLVQRGFTKESALEWRLGYSPNTGTALVDFLRKQSITDLEMRQAGLIAQRSGASIDMFRGRLMIPLQDPQGQVIGFTARVLSESDFGPKYINTAQTVLYDKSRHIFGLHLAKQAIRENHYAVITEGNLDVIASHQAGVRQTVATAGTAITEGHLKGLGRFTSDIRLCFDSDKAGINATERAITIASKLHISLNIIDLKDGKDPDELIQKDPKLWLSLINSTNYAIDWLIDRLKERFDISSAEGKRHFTDAILPIITNLDDAVEKDHYLAKIATMLGIKREALDQKLIKTSPLTKLVKSKPRENLIAKSQEQIEIERSEDNLLSIMIKRVDLRAQLGFLEPEIWRRELSRELFKVLMASPDIKEDRLVSLDKISDYVKIELLKYDELYSDLEPSELTYEATRLRARLIEHYVKEQKQAIVKQLTQADDRLTQQLLESARKLDELIRLNLGDNHA